MVIYILTIGVIIYLIWGFIFHECTKSLTSSIFLEYVLTAALVLILVVAAVT